MLYRFLLAIAMCLVSAAPTLAQGDVVDAQLRINTAVQDALVWTGHYDGLTDGSMGERSISAIAAYQREQGWQATGDLAPEQKLQLLQNADLVRRRLGFRPVVDAKARTTIGLPMALLSGRQDTQRGSRYFSEGGDFEVVIGLFAPPEGGI